MFELFYQDIGKIAINDSSNKVGKKKSGKNFLFLMRIFSLLGSDQLSRTYVNVERFLIFL
jgi:hypothetical protein